MIKAIVGIGAAVATYLVADKVVHVKTGKHIHTHVANYFRELCDWAREWLSCHPELEKVYLNAKAVAINIAAAIKRGVDRVNVKIRGKGWDNRYRVIKEEEIPLDEAQNLVENADSNGQLVLACAE